MEIQINERYIYKFIYILFNKIENEEILIEYFWEFLKMYEYILLKLQYFYLNDFLVKQ